VPAEHGTAEEKLGEVSGEPREERGEAPDGHTRRNHSLANAPIRPIAEGQGGKRVDEEESGAEQTDERIAEMEFLLDQG